MPRAGIITVLLMVLLLVPIVGDFLSVMAVFLIVGLLSPFTESCFKLAKSLGVPHLALWIEFGIITAIVLALAAAVGWKLLRKNLTDQERRRYLNALILVLGVPIMLTLAWVRLALKWVH